MSQNDWRKYTRWTKLADDQFQKIFSYKPEDIIVFDLETTGFNRAVDEILQISILSGTGETLLDTYVKPLKKKSWADAQKVNGISPDMVADAPLFSEIKEQVQDVFNRAKLVVGYNSVGFDMEFLSVAGVDTKKSTKHFDVMIEYSPTEMRWSSKSQDWQYVKLVDAAEHYSLEFDAHDAKRDTAATLHVFEQMLQDENPGNWLDYHEFLMWLKEQGKQATGFRIMAGWHAWVECHDQLIAGEIDGVYNGTVYYPDGTTSSQSGKSSGKSGNTVVYVNQSAAKEKTKRQPKEPSGWLCLFAFLAALAGIRSFIGIFNGTAFFEGLLFGVFWLAAAALMGIYGFGYSISDMISDYLDKKTNQ